MTDYNPPWLDEPFPLDHSITWRERFARKDWPGRWTHSMTCGCVEGGPNE